MYQPDINTYLEAIKQQYDSLLQENKKLKLENKKLLETNLDYKRKISYYKNIYKTTSLLKLGSDWQIEGSKIVNLCQTYKIHFKDFYFIKDIYFSTITNNGEIIFLSQNIIHLLINNAIFILINDQFIPYDEFNTKKYKYSYDTPYIRYLLDDEDNLCVFSNNFLKKYNLNTKLLISTLNMPNHVGILVKNNLIYLTCYDKSFRIYDSDKLILILNSAEEIRSNLLLINNVGYSITARNNLVVFDIQNKTTKIIKINVSEEIKRIFNIDNYIIFKNNSNLVIFDTISRDIEEVEVDEDIKFLNVVDKFILISNTSSLIMYDFRSKKKMYIKIKDTEILNVSSSSKDILIEGQNMLRVYSYSE